MPFVPFYTITRDPSRHSTTSRPLLDAHYAISRPSHTTRTTCSTRHNPYYTKADISTQGYVMDDDLKLRAKQALVVLLVIAMVTTPIAYVL